MAALLFALVEGLASGALFLRRVLLSKPAMETLHTRHDPELGWVNKAGAFVPDLYGPGVWLRTNSRGFREETETAQKAAPVKIRVICSGDSFTLGVGVDNEHTWCRELAKQEPRLETVNMGQGGYGFDQAVLWYRRDAAGLEHKVHVLAFITDDFNRMLRTDRGAREKPRLVLRGGALAAANVPIQEPTSWALLKKRARRQVEELRTLALLRELAGPEPAQAAPADAETKPLVAKLIEELQEADRKKGIVLVLVHLPILADYWSDADYRPWKVFLEAQGRRLGFRVIDLAEDLRRLPHPYDLYLSGKDPRVPGVAAGHFSRQGNAWAAKALLQARPFGLSRP